MSEAYTAEDRAEHAVLCDSIAPAPWCVSYCYGAIRHVIRNCEDICSEHDGFGKGPEDWERCKRPGKYDGEFVAAASWGYPAALALIDTLEAALREMDNDPYFRSHLRTNFPEHSERLRKALEATQ